MAISSKRLRAADYVEAVEAGAPLNCILHLHPLTAELEAEFASRCGAPDGVTPQGDGTSKISMMLDPLRILKARRWLVEKLLTGVDGLESEDESGGGVTRVVFGPAVLEVLADDYFEIIRDRAAGVAGRLRKAVRGNLSP